MQVEGLSYNLVVC